MPTLTKKTDLRVAIIHDWLTGMRGGEAVLEALIDLFDSAEIFTLIHKKGSCSSKIENRRIYTSFIQKLPFSGRLYRHYLPFFPTAIEEFDLHGFDLVISSSHCVAKGVIVPPGIPHISYIHSPMRYVWDMYRQYFQGSGILQKFVIPFFANYLRMWDSASATRVDQYVVNSKFVAERVRRYYGRDSIVINPPCGDSTYQIPTQKRDDFYLVFGAFVPYKRLDLAIQACKNLNRRLIVAGHGPELKKLKSLAGNDNHIEFIERPSNDQAKQLFETTKALIFPGVEDFGIVPVEAQQKYCPVIALGHGGALETVVHLKTGYLFKEQNVESLTDAILEFEKLTLKPADFKKNVSKFSTISFKQEMLKIIQRFY